MLQLYWPLVNISRYKKGPAFLGSCWSLTESLDTVNIYHEIAHEIGSWRRRGYKIFFMLNSTEHDSFPAITKTYLYNVDPLKPHFYIVKLGFTEVYITAFISAQKIGLWILVRTATTRRFLRVPTICLSTNMKNIRIFIKNISFFGGKIFNIIKSACFRYVINLRVINNSWSWKFVR